MGARAWVTLAAGSLLACASLLHHPATPGTKTTTYPLPLPPAPVSQPHFQHWTVVGVGDVLLHGSLQRQAANSGFDQLWSEITPLFESATVAYANLEGPTAPGLTRLGRSVQDPGVIFDDNVYTSYPMFNYPPALIGSLQASGIDVVSTANNHSLDRRADGVRRTIAQLDAYGLPFTGTREGDQSTRTWHTTTQNDGFVVAWLACTFSTNGLPDTAAQVLHCYRDRAHLIQQVRILAADPYLGAIIITPHWGVEYASAPSQQDKMLGRELLDAGATAVLGAHPHVPQPIEIHRTPDGREGVIVYSMGNFVSGQFHRLHTRAAIAARLHFTGIAHQRATLVGVQAIHLEMTRARGFNEVRPLPFDGNTPAIVRHLDDMFGPTETLLTLNNGRAPASIHLGQPEI